MQVCTDCAVDMARNADRCERRAAGPCDRQRGHDARDAGDRAVGARIEQQAHHLLVIRAAVAKHHSLHERRPAKIVDMVEWRARSRGARIRGVDATTPTPSGVRRCGRNSGGLGFGARRDDHGRFGVTLGDAVADAGLVVCAVTGERGHGSVDSVEQEIDLLPGTPPLYAALAKLPTAKALKQKRTRFLATGAMVHESIAEAFRERWGPRIIPMYHTTEAGAKPHWRLYTGELTFQEPVTLRAKACRLGYLDSTEIVKPINRTGN